MALYLWRLILDGTFNLDFLWTSAIALRNVIAAYVGSVSEALSTSDPKNGRCDGNYPNKSAGGTNLSLTGVSLHALDA